MVVKLNTVRLNGASLNHASLNGVGERLRASAGGGGGEVIPPEEPDAPDVPVTYILTASASNGVVSASVNGNAVTLPYTANEGDVVVVEVTANDGYVFEGWSDGSTDNPRSITMTADVTLSATCVEQVVESKYIEFADPAVEAVLMANGVSSDGVGITKEDAAAVTDKEFELLFRSNTEITSFNELEHFTGLTVIGRLLASGGGFHSCTNLRSVKMPPYLEALGYGAFYKTQISEIDLPASFSNLWNQCLRLTNLTTLICRATTPPAFGDRPLNDTPLYSGNGTIYVPDASVEAYKTATNWSSYADRIHPLSEIEGSPYIEFEDPAVEAICVENWSSDGIGLTKEDAAAVTDIKDKFKNNTEIVSFDEFRYFTGVTQVGAMLYYDSGFRGCTNLERITLPDSVVDLGYNSFYNTKISTINLDHVVRMHAQVFFNCANLSGDIVAESLTTMIGAFQFYGTSINSFSAPLLTEVGVGAFRNSGIVYANNLGKLKTVEEGGYGMFEQSKVKEVTFPATVETLGAYTCQNCASLRMVQCLAVTPPSLGVKGFESVPGFIYVPNASVDAYKSATNWATYASKIYAVKYAVPANNILVGSVTSYKTIGQTGEVSDDAIKAVTDYIPVNGGDSITWGSSMGRDMLLEFDENFVKVDHWSSTGSSRTITTNSRTRYVRTGFVIPAVTFSYVKNNTTGEYIFKGKEV